jgi:hypothetical protein
MDMNPHELGMLVQNDHRDSTWEEVLDEACMMQPHRNAGLVCSLFAGQRPMIASSGGWCPLRA